MGKSTHCVSDGSAALAWFQQHLPVVQDQGGFPKCVNAEFCPCGNLGRVSVEPGVPKHGFGLHTVHTNASSHRTLGDLSISTIEGHVTQKLKTASDVGEYDPLFDLNTGFWVGNLDPYVIQFAGQPILALEWHDDINNRTYYSLIVQVRRGSLTWRWHAAQHGAGRDAMRQG